MKTFSEFQGRKFFKHHKLFTGKFIDKENGIITRWREGLLNDEVEKDGNVIHAIESLDCTHYEHWKDGVLHCETEPAVIDTLDDREEWWYEGERINPVG